RRGRHPDPAQLRAAPDSGRPERGQADVPDTARHRSAIVAGCRSVTTEPVAHRRHARRTGGGIPQLPFRALTNPFTPLTVLSADHVEDIHRTSLRILAEVGVEVLGDRAIDLLVAAGASVDRS